MKKAAIGVVAFAIIGAGFGYSHWSANQVLETLKTHNAHVIQQLPGVRLVDQKISTSLMGSTHEINVEVTCLDGQALDKPMQIGWRDRISNGPVPGGKQLGLVVVDSELILSTDDAAKWSKITGEKPLVQSHTQIDFTGDYRTTLSVPNFKSIALNRYVIESQGVTMVAEGQLRALETGAHTFELKSPGFSLKLLPNTQTWQNDSTIIKVGALEMHGQFPAYDTKSISVFGQMMRPHQHTGSIASLQMKRSMSSEMPVYDVAMNDLRFHLEDTYDKALFSSQAEFSTKVLINGVAIDDLKFKVSTHRVHAPTYATHVEKAWRDFFVCKPETAFEANKENDVIKQWADFFIYNPEYSIDHLKMTVGGKEAQLNFKIGVQGITQQEANEQPAGLFMNKTYAQFESQTPTAWVEELEKRIVASTNLGDPSSIRDKIMLQKIQRINQDIEQSVNTGFVVREGNQLKTTVRFEKGQFFLNGKLFASNLEEFFMGLGLR
jgi:uncharacterized protein YdgA (DUF945 family)